MGLLSADRSPSGASPPEVTTRTNARALTTAAVANLALRTLASLTSLALFYLVARRSTDGTVGQLALIITVLTTGAIVARFGTDVTLAAEGGRTVLCSRPAEFNHALSTARRMVLRSALLTSGMLTLIAVPLARVLIGGPLTPVLLAAAAVIPMAWASMSGGALRGMGATLFATVIDGGIGPTLTLAAVWFLFEEPTTTHVMAAWLVSWLVAASVGEVRLRRFLAGTVGRLSGDNIDLAVTGRQIVSIGLLNLVLASMDLVVLGLFETEETVGHYAVAARLVVASTLILTAVNQVIHPRLAAAHATHGASLRPVIRNVTTALAIIAVGLTAVLIVFRTVLLELFGPSYTAAAPALVVLALGQCVVLATGPAGAVLLMTGNAHRQRQATVAAVVLNLVGNFFLVPIRGMWGAAIATAVALAVKNALSARWAWETVRA